MTALIAWPQGTGIAYSTPDGRPGFYPSVLAAVHGAHVAAVAGDRAAALSIGRAIVRRWHR